MQWRTEFRFPGSPARGPDRALPPRPPLSTVLPRPREELEEEVRWLQASRQGSPDCSSGTPSPQLWEHRLHPGSSSPPSRAQAIAGYRREMLDLVRGLPESVYELSLRDIVEHHHHPSSAPSSPPSVPLPTPSPPPPQPTAVVRDHEPANAAVAGAADEHAAAKQGKKQGRMQRAVRRQRSRSLERSVSLDTGLLIKFLVPLSICRGGKKKVSPKPDAGTKDGKKKKQRTKKTKEAAARQKPDEEWWTNSKSEFSEASGSSSRTSSTGSSNSNGSVRNGHGNGGNSNPRAPVRSRSRKRNGCYAFFRGNRTRNGGTQD